MGQILGMVRATGCSRDNVQYAGRRCGDDQNGRAEPPERPVRLDQSDEVFSSAKTSQSSAVSPHGGDIRLLSGMEEVAAAMRRGADDLERWGRCADMDRAEKVRRLGVLVAGLTQQLSTEVAAAVVALADIRDMQLGSPGAPGWKGTT